MHAKYTSWSACRCIEKGKSMHCAGVQTLSIDCYGAYDNDRSDLSALHLPRQTDSPLPHVLTSLWRCRGHRLYTASLPLPLGACTTTTARSLPVLYMLCQHSLCQLLHIDHQHSAKPFTGTQIGNQVIQRSKRCDGKMPAAATVPRVGRRREAVPTHLTAYLGPTPPS